MSSPDAPNQPSSSQDATDFLRNASFSRGEQSAPPPENVTASDLLLGAYDPAKLHPLAGLGDKLDYLLLDDDKVSELPGSGTAIPSRGWSDDLCYGTGTMYLSGLALGGVWGFREGAGRPLAVSNTRLRINSILNSITRRGTFLGNSAGVVALAYNGINSTIDALRGKHDTFGSMTAGALTGALYKSTAGVKPALAAATLVSAFHPDHPPPYAFSISVKVEQNELSSDYRIYHLEIVQQPETSAEFGTAALSRLPLAPPLVVQLIIRDGRGNILDSEPDLPFLISHLSLYTADGATALDTSSRPGTHFPPDRLLYGNLVSSPHHLRNLQGRAGVYFLFPDVSIRVQGRYSLRVTLMRLSGHVRRPRSASRALS
ncbi:hypothetical protein EWM64_g9186 [Hericium alpestre]|uniref:Velvet domain-containing protein n=1 Tax=Hericium alpestre TaxID=135208 RepID=A0A4Y9ZL66_9AGAM|nr:hypothetical protein EWM64_g9186 [Hericium alpestre]